MAGAGTDSVRIKRVWWDVASPVCRSVRSMVRARQVVVCGERCGAARCGAGAGPSVWSECEVVLPAIAGFLLRLPSVVPRWFDRCPGADFQPAVH